MPSKVSVPTKSFPCLKRTTYFVIVPNNCTDHLQPLDISVNKSAKEFKFHGNVINVQLENDLTEPVDMRISVMKPLTAQWIIELFYYLISNPKIIINGWHGAGISFVDTNKV